MSIADEESGGIRFDLSEPAQVTSLRAACFGGQTVDVTFGLRTGSSWLGASQEIDCDEQFHTIEVDERDVAVVEIGAIGPATYVVIAGDGVPTQP